MLPSFFFRSFKPVIDSVTPVFMTVLQFNSLTFLLRDFFPVKSISAWRHLSHGRKEQEDDRSSSGPFSTLSSFVFLALLTCKFVGLLYPRRHAHKTSFLITSQAY